MKEGNIVEMALENVEKSAGIHGKWIPEQNVHYDGRLELLLDDTQVTFYVEVKKEFRYSHLKDLLGYLEDYQPYMIVAERIFAGVKLELQKKHIAFLETNGNIYFDVNQRMVFIQLNSPVPKLKEVRNRAFTKTGLKVLFYILNDETLLHLTRRELASRTETALGHANYVIQGLKQAGFLIKLIKNTFKLTRKQELLKKWIEGYSEKLKPALLLGHFRFVNKDDFFHWKNMYLASQTKWGGEAAGDILTGYLNAGKLTLYTHESRQDLIRNYKMVPDDGGNISVYEKFWNDIEEDSQTVPPLLAYADLIIMDDRRCQETAQKIYDTYLQNQF